jgi:hypothetical protein
MAECMQKDPDVRPKSPRMAPLLVNMNTIKVENNSNPAVAVDLPLEPHVVPGYVKCW